MHEPFTTYFQSQTITTTVDGVSSEIAVPEPVRQNRTFLSLTENDNSSAINLVAGKNCRLSDDSSAVIAELSGYPLLNRSRQGKKTVIDARIIPIISIAEDKMLATLTLYPHLPGTVPLSPGDIVALCREQDVSCGVDERAIQETVKQVEQLGQPLQEVAIARGLLPVDGKDAFLRFEVEIGPLPGKILQDGSIDWRERKMFIGIDKDELIAIKVPLTKGTPGTDIHCFPIPQKPGKDISVKVAGDAKYLEENRQIRATSSGVLSIVGDTDIKVSAKQTIDGDVDFSVGNIESNDGLEIKGDVKPGFTISCRGDLSIGGNVHGATIAARGNSKITKGLIGEQASLTGGGDVEISFVERATISSDGSVVIKKGAFYACVGSKKMILCRPDSKIVGGTFTSSLDFIGGIVGSDNAVPTIIAAGVDPERLRQRDTLQATILDQENELKNLLQVNGPEYIATAVYKSKETALQKRVTHLKKLNLIPGCPLYSRHDPAFTYCCATIAVEGRIVSGTKIRIGNTRTTVEEDTTAIRFHIDRRTGHIVATPYTRGKK